MSESSNTFHMNSSPADSSSFTLYTNPFMPQAIQTGFSDTAQKQFQLKFNKGFIFDYANGGKRVEVGGLSHDIGEDKESFQLKIEFNHHNGAILNAEILKQSDGGASFTNFAADSQIEGEAVTLVPEAVYFIDVCEVEGGTPQEIYIRENIHLHIRGHIQHFDEFVDEDGNAGVGNGVMKPLSSLDANGTIEYRALCKDPEEGNELRIRTEGSNIYFFVPSGSCSS